MNRSLALLYLLSAGLSALAGILLAAAPSSGQPCLGISYFLDGLTAVLLGGMALELGKPKVGGTLAGIVLPIGLLNGAALRGWTDSQRQIGRGSLLLAVRVGDGLAVRPLWGEALWVIVGRLPWRAGPRRWHFI